MPLPAINSGAIERPSFVRDFVLSFVFVLGLWIAPTAAIADYESGIRAYEAGDYEGAAREFLEAAEENDARAQNNLGAL